MISFAIRSLGSSSRLHQEWFCLILAIALVGCGRTESVVRSVSTSDLTWEAEVLAVPSRLGTFDAELRLKHNGKIVRREVVLGGRDAEQDVEHEITGLKITDQSVIVLTRGTFTSNRLAYPLKAD